MLPGAAAQGLAAAATRESAPLWKQPAFLWTLGGAAPALATLGIFGDLAGVLLVEQRGPVLTVAGTALVYCGVAVLAAAGIAWF